MDPHTTVAVVVPTLNAAQLWPSFHRALVAQIPQPRRIIVIDSSSTDRTAQLATDAGYELYSIAQTDFDHGGTRQLAIELLSDARVVVFLSQDTMLAAPDALSQLVDRFADPHVGAAYGRQLPRHEATPIEAHARYFNYPGTSELRDLSSRDRLGFKAIFISNSFAAYRRDALMSVGGFPKNVLFGEDTITAAKLLKANWKIAYVAEARAYHSHAYTWTEEFKRYFDIGVLHNREAWLLKEFGQTTAEGRRFVGSEISYLLSKDWSLIPSAFIRTGLKLLGYRLGRREHRLAASTKRRLSMQPSYWS